MLKPKLVIFDFDGTIADTITTGLKHANEWLTEKGKKPLTLAEFHELRKLTIPEALKQFDISMFEVPVLALKLQQKMRSSMTHVKPFPRMPYTLATLVELYPLQVLTSNAKDIVEAFFKEHSIMVFNTITAEKNIFGKDASLKKILKKAELTPDEAIYVGDEVRDIEASHKAGMKIISVTWGLQSREALEKAGADYLADKPEDILTLLA